MENNFGIIVFTINFSQIHVTIFMVKKSKQQNLINR
jgi:hypothetical protein